jgi:hypothetical protein
MYRLVPHSDRALTRRFLEQGIEDLLRQFRHAKASSERAELLPVSQTPS